MITLAEGKPYKVNGNAKDSSGRKYLAHYYPGVIFEFRTVRDPMPNIVKIFFPCILLTIFLLGTFRIGTDDHANRLANLSIVLLTYVAILDLVTGSVPNINKTTIANKFIIFYCILSLAP